MDAKQEQTTATGWHVWLGEASHGPLDWSTVVAWAREGRIGPSTGVWHTLLPGWVPAQHVAGLFPAPNRATPSGAAPAQARAPRASSHRLRWSLTAVAAALIVLGAVLGGLAAAGKLGNKSPVAEMPTHVYTVDDTPSVDIPTQTPTVTDTTLFDWPMAGPTVIDVASSEISNTMVSPAGAVIEAGLIAVDIPADAVAADTNIVLTRLDAPFHRDPSEVSDPEAVEARAISPSYDIGPAGTSFAQPATITLHYDLGYGPEEIDPSRIAVAYWTGESWAVAGGTVDPEARTVSVQLKEIEGSIAVAIAVGTVLGAVINRVIKWKTGGDEGVKSDPLAEGRAKEYITPKDPTVQQQVSKAVIFNKVNNETKALDDPDLDTWMADANTKKQDLSLAFTDSTGKPIKMTYDRGKGSNWQTPSHYFTTGTVNSGAYSGDCTDATSAAISIFRAKGLPAKGVFGYADNGDPTQPHNWGEVLIGGVPYCIDDQGGLWSPERDDWFRDIYKPCTDPNDPRYQSMYDENGQQPYDPEWWAAYDVSGHWEGEGTITVNDFVTTLPLTMDITLNADGTGTLTSLFSGGEESTLRFSYSGGTLTSLGTGATLSATVSKKGDRLVMNGHGTNGVSSVTWTVTKTQ